MTVAGYYNRQGDFAKLVENLRKRIELEPQNPEAHYTLGHVSMGQGESRLPSLRQGEDDAHP